jgi:hypothetical protein
MITVNDIELLQGLTKKAPHAVKLTGGKVLLYSKWFALEPPAALIDPAFNAWEAVANDVARNWRNVMPKGDGEYAQGIRWANPDDGVGLIKLIADSATAIIHPSMFDLVNKKLPEPEFRVFVGEKPTVAIYSEGQLIGGVSQMKA